MHCAPPAALHSSTLAASNASIAGIEMPESEMTEYLRPGGCRFPDKKAHVTLGISFEGRSLEDREDGTDRVDERDRIEM